MQVQNVSQVYYNNHVNSLQKSKKETPSVSFGMKKPEFGASVRKMFLPVLSVVAAMGLNTQIANAQYLKPQKGDTVNIGGIDFYKSQVRDTVTNGIGHHVVTLDDGSVFMYKDHSMKQKVKWPTIYIDNERKQTCVFSCVLDAFIDPPSKNSYWFDDTTVEYGIGVGEGDTLIISNDPRDRVIGLYIQQARKNSAE